jgi:hypothetical protein
LSSSTNKNLSPLRVERFLCCEEKRTRLQPIRTASEIHFKIIIEPLVRHFLYQKFEQKAKELHALGMSYYQIGNHLKISKKTAKLAVLYNQKS